MGSQIYVHKNYATEIVPADIWAKAQSLGITPARAGNIIPDESDLRIGEDHPRSRG